MRLLAVPVVKALVFRGNRLVSALEWLLSLGFQVFKSN